MAAIAAHITSLVKFSVAPSSTCARLMVGESCAASSASAASAAPPPPQCVEKYLLVRRQVRFDRRHDRWERIRLLEELDTARLDAVRQLVVTLSEGTRPAVVTLAVPPLQERFCLADLDLLLFI